MYLDMKDSSTIKPIVQGLSKDVCKRLQIVPIAEDEGEIRIGKNGNVTNEYLVELELGIAKSLNRSIQFLEMSSEEFSDKFIEVFGSSREQVYLSPNEDYLDQIIKEAIQLKSSDIHFEMQKDEARVRIRVDGLLLECFKIAPKDYQIMINKVKVRSGLDISQKRLPQDGRIHLNDYKMDVRVSTLPTKHGEKAVLRLLNQSDGSLSLDKVGFSEEALRQFKTALNKATGLILISGPTGSGKTTTLYSALKYLNSPTRNIITIEDPIEYTLEGINQVQLKEDIGLDFPKALKTFLRQDPDIIMVGEIRDPDTAKMAIRASLTGHLVLSTIHTNSAYETISRLEDMGVPNYLIRDTLNSSLSQRLLRKVCVHCKEEEPKGHDDVYVAIKDKFEIEKSWKGKGCPKCFETGYSGRVAVIDQIDSQQIKTGEYIPNRLGLEALKWVKNGVVSFEDALPLLLEI